MLPASRTVDEADQHPEVFAHKTVGRIADYFEDVIGKLTATALEFVQRFVKP